MNVVSLNESTAVFLREGFPFPFIPRKLSRRMYPLSQSSFLKCAEHILAFRQCESPGEMKSLRVLLTNLIQSLQCFSLVWWLGNVKKLKFWFSEVYLQPPKYYTIRWYFDLNSKTECRIGVVLALKWIAWLKVFINWLYTMRSLGSVPN